MTKKRINSDLASLEKRFEQGKTDYDRKKDVLDSLRRELRKLETIQDVAEWPKTEEELKDVFYRLEKTNKEFGNEKTVEIVEQFKDQIPEVIKEKNVKLAQELIDNMRSLDFALIDQGLGAKFEISLIYNFNEDFDLLDWTNPNRARQLINQGMQIANDNPTKQKLRPIVIELYKLLPEHQKPMSDNDDGVLVG